MLQVETNLKRVKMREHLRQRVKNSQDSSHISGETDLCDLNTLKRRIESIPLHLSQEDHEIWEKREILGAYRANLTLRDQANNNISEIKECFPEIVRELSRREKDPKPLPQWMKQDKYIGKFLERNPKFEEVWGKLFWKWFSPANDDLTIKIAERFKFPLLNANGEPKKDAKGNRLKANFMVILLNKINLQAWARESGVAKITFQGLMRFYCQVGMAIKLPVRINGQVYAIGYWDDVYDKKTGKTFTNVGRSFLKRGNPNIVQALRELKWNSVRI